jgi:site-specific recombinase XerD
MKYSTNFYLEKRKGVIKNLPINLSVVFNKQRMIYYTGKRCHLAQWDKNAEDKWGNKTAKLKKNQTPINGQNSHEFMADLERIKIAVDDLFKLYDVTKQVPTPARLRTDLNVSLGKSTKICEPETFFGLFDKYMKRSGLSKNTSTKIGTVIEHLKKFDANANFEKCNIQYFIDFQAYLLGTGEMSKNSVSSYATILKSFLKYCVKTKKIKDNRFEDFPVDTPVFGEPVYLTIEERDLLFNAEITNPALARTRDRFVLQCMIGCRFEDFMKLKKSNIINGCIEYIAGKTKDQQLITARVPLTKKAMAIIEKYNLENDNLIPKVNKSVYNVAIKALLKKLEINRLVTIPDKRTRESKQVPICDYASSHMARRVFIGSLIKRDVLLPTIGSMSGHSKNSKALGRYFHIDNEDQKRAMNLIE